MNIVISKPHKFGPLTNIILHGASWVIFTRIVNNIANQQILQKSGLCYRVKMQFDCKFKDFNFETSEYQLHIILISIYMHYCEIVIMKNIVVLSYTVDLIDIIYLYSSPLTLLRLWIIIAITFWKLKWHISRFLTLLLLKVLGCQLVKRKKRLWNPRNEKWTRKQSWQTWPARESTLESLRDIFIILSIFKWLIW